MLNQQKTDESTADDSVSQTTMTACVGNGIETAACYLQQLGRAFWEWPADGKQANCFPCGMQQRSKITAGPLQMHSYCRV